MFCASSRSVVAISGWGSEGIKRIVGASLYILCKLGIWWGCNGRKTSRAVSNNLPFIS